MKRIFRLGTRGSLLALAQAKGIQRCLKKNFPKRRFQLIIIKTTGDEFQGVELFKKNNIGVFTKVLETKLLSCKIDIAIHSLKDLPTELPKGLILAAFPKRLDPSDVLISKKRWAIKDLPKGASVGTGSPRRKRQLYRLRPDLKLCDIRGNLDTRVKRVIRDQKYDAIIVAKAGLLRIKKYLKYARVIPLQNLLPAVGQAALGIETRSDDFETLNIVKKLNHTKTEKAVSAEREFLKVLQGGCRVPVGIYSKIKGPKIYLKAAVFSPNHADYVEGQIMKPVAQYKKAGAELARQLLKKGAGKFLREARHV